VQLHADGLDRQYALMSLLLVSLLMGQPTKTESVDTPQMGLL
jgi:hypothetical protein